MSGNAAADEGSQPTEAGRFLRPKIRQATLIIPQTGERLRKTFTLRNAPPNRHGEDDDERQPLLRPEATVQHQGSAITDIVQRISDVAVRGYGFATSRVGQGILKCSLAYLLGSMATFVPQISGLLGRNDGKHMVATVTVYFNPARSAGSMEEGILLAFAAFLYAAFISFTSMAVSVSFGRLDLIRVGHAIVLIVFCGGGLGFVGLVKMKLNNPLVSVACSLASLAIITVLTKEEAVQVAQFSYVKIWQVLKMVIMGSVASTLVSLLVRPISARTELREAIDKATDLLEEQLTSITTSFLAGEEDPSRPSNSELQAQYKPVFVKLRKDLCESKYEHYLLGTEKEYRISVQLVKCIEQLAQNIAGLRSAAATQFALLAKPAAPGTVSPWSFTSTTHAKRPVSPLMSPEFIGALENVRNLGAIVERPEESSESEEGDRRHTAPVQSPDHEDGLPTVVTAAEIFALFLEHLGPPMKSLAYTLKETLNDLPYTTVTRSQVSPNSHFRESLEEANQLFANARKEALLVLYKNKVLAKARSFDVAADYEEVAASCGYFSSSLQDVAESSIEYLDVLEELRCNRQTKPKRRSWKWLKFWCKTNRTGDVESDDPEPSYHDTQLDAGLGARVPDPRRRFSTAPDPGRPEQSKRITFRLWRALSVFRREDVRFAFKVGVGAILYAMFAFIPATRPTYSHFRGEWGLLSYMLVCSMTVGASNTTGFHRFAGTCLGAVLAIIAWIVSDDNPFILAFLGWFVSLFCFYIIVAKGKGPMGRFILLTYNLSALYAYSLSMRDEEDDDDEGGISPEIWEIVYHRVVAVMVGCIWGIVVTRVIFPIKARKKLRKGLSVLWLRMGLIWKRDPLGILEVWTGDEQQQRSSYMDIRESLELQRFLTYLETLKKSAVSEFQLRGPFPEKEWTSILRRTEDMLDAFHAMNVVIIKDLKASPGEAELLRHTRMERGQLSSRISHLFSVLASSISLEYPINDALPNIEHTRDRLLAKIFEFRKQATDKDIKDEDYELLYAYALVTGQIGNDIIAIGQEIEQLFGVLNEENLKLE